MSGKPCAPCCSMLAAPGDPAETVTVRGSCTLACDRAWVCTPCLSACAKPAWAFTAVCHAVADARHSGLKRRGKRAEPRRTEHGSLPVGAYVAPTNVGAASELTVGGQHAGDNVTGYRMRNAFDKAIAKGCSLKLSDSKGRMRPYRRRFCSPKSRPLCRSTD